MLSLRDLSGKCGGVSAEPYSVKGRGRQTAKGPALRKHLVGTWSKLTLTVPVCCLWPYMQFWHPTSHPCSGVEEGTRPSQSPKGLESDFNPCSMEYLLWDPVLAPSDSWTSVVPSAE